MSFARWSVARHGGEVRVRLSAARPLSEPDLDELWREVRPRLGQEISTVVFTGRSTWVAVHRHSDVAGGRWHVRSAVGPIK